MKKIIISLFTLFLFCFSLTILFLSMRAVMAVGGFCAEGGAYKIQVHCPKGAGLLTPLSIFGIFIGGAMYVYSSIYYKHRPQWWYFFWSALFLSLGWNFFEFSFRNGIDIGKLICGILFILMGLPPLLFFDKSTWISGLMGEKLKNQPNQPTIVQKFYENRILLFLLHCITTIGAILLAVYSF